jgi:hypothetical protein
VVFLLIYDALVSGAPQELQSRPALESTPQAGQNLPGRPAAEGETCLPGAANIGAAAGKSSPGWM